MGTRGEILFYKLRAVDLQGTTVALRIAGGANISAEKYDPVTEITALLGRQDFAELLFHLLRVFALGKSQTTTDANTVGVTDNAAGLSI